MGAGRPPKWKSQEELQAQIDAYFDETPEKEWTITGLALALDTTRQTLCEYVDRDKYTDTIKKAKLRVECSYEKALRRQGRSGDIFALKNFGWRDKRENEVNHSLSISFDSSFNQ